MNTKFFGFSVIVEGTVVKDAMTLSIMVSSIIIIKKVSWNKSSLLLEIFFPKYTDITTKLKQKLVTKVIRGSSEEAWISLDRESN